LHLAALDALNVPESRVHTYLDVEYTRTLTLKCALACYISSVPLLFEPPSQIWKKGVFENYTSIVTRNRVTKPQKLKDDNVVYFEVRRCK
jgi:hypothetical protein